MIVIFTHVSQTVSWLGAESSVLEDCVHSLSKPTDLKHLLRHHKQLGHLEQHGESLPVSTALKYDVYYNNSCFTCVCVCVCSSTVQHGRQYHLLPLCEASEQSVNKYRSVRWVGFASGPERGLTCCIICG